MSIEAALAENTAALRELIARLTAAPLPIATGPIPTPYPTAAQQAAPKVEPVKVEVVKVSAAPAEVATPAPAEQAITTPAADAATYDSTRALMLEVVKKLSTAEAPTAGRDKCVELLAGVGLRDLKVATHNQLVALTAAARALL